MSYLYKRSNRFWRLLIKHIKKVSGAVHLDPDGIRALRGIGQLWCKNTIAAYAELGDVASGGRVASVDNVDEAAAGSYDRHIRVDSARGIGRFHHPCKVAGEVVDLEAGDGVPRGVRGRLACQYPHEADRAASTSCHTQKYAQRYYADKRDPAEKTQLHAIPSIFGLHMSCSDRCSPWRFREF